MLSIFNKLNKQHSRSKAKMTNSKGSKSFQVQLSKKIRSGVGNLETNEKSELQQQCCCFYYTTTFLMLELESNQIDKLPIGYSFRLMYTHNIFG